MQIVFKDLLDNSSTTGKMSNAFVISKDVLLSVKWKKGKISFPTNIKPSESKQFTGESSNRQNHMGGGQGVSPELSQKK